MRYNAGHIRPRAASQMSPPRALLQFAVQKNLTYLGIATAFPHLPFRRAVPPHQRGHHNTYECRCRTNTIITRLVVLVSSTALLTRYGPYPCILSMLRPYSAGALATLIAVSAAALSVRHTAQTLFSASCLSGKSRLVRARDTAVQTLRLQVRLPFHGWISTHAMRIASWSCTSCPSERPRIQRWNYYRYAELPPRSARPSRDGSNPS